MTTTPPPQAVRARVGTLLLFLVNGMTFASLVPRYPEIKAGLMASQTLWGLAIGLGPLGGLALGLAAARLMARFGSRNVAIWPQLASTASMILLALAGHIAWVFVAMILMSAFDALTDIAMNYQGLRVQNLYRRSIINTFHGFWSVGAVAGGLIGSAMAQWRVSITSQALVTIVVLALVLVWSWSLMLAGRDADTADPSTPDSGPVSSPDGSSTPDAGPVPSPAGSEGHPDPALAAAGTSPASPVGTSAIPADQAARNRVPVPLGSWLRIVALGLVGAVAGGIEIGGASWAPLYLNSAFTVTPFVAGLGFVGLMSAETLGRLTGDAIVNRFGQAVAVAQGSIVCLIGMIISIAWPTPATAILGFTAAGWGVATIIPLAMDVANRLPGVTDGLGLTVTSWLMRLGFMAFPVGIGALGDAISLRWALICLPAGAAVMLALVPLFRPIPAERR